MKALKLEEFDDFYGNIQASVSLIREQEFEENKERLIRETNELPKNFQHRIAFMRQYVEDFDIRFWAVILSCCQAALKICKSYPKGNFCDITPETLDKLVKGFGLNVDEKAFAFSLAIANFNDAQQKPDFDNLLAMCLPDPWPISPLGSFQYAKEIVIYKNSDEYARIEGECK